MNDHHCTYIEQYLNVSCIILISQQTRKNMYRSSRCNIHAKPNAGLEGRRICLYPPPPLPTPPHFCWLGKIFFSCLPPGHVITGRKTCQAGMPPPLRAPWKSSGSFKCSAFCDWSALNGGDWKCAAIGGMNNNGGGGGVPTVGQRGSVFSRIRRSFRRKRETYCINCGHVSKSCYHSKARPPRIQLSKPNISGLYWLLASSARVFIR